MKGDKVIYCIDKFVPRSVFFATLFELFQWATACKEKKKSETWDVKKFVARVLVFVVMTLDSLLK